MENIAAYIDSLLPELTQLRRDFHRYPELAWREIRTSSKIAAYLTDLGYEVLIGDDVCSSENKTGVPDEDTMKLEYERAVNQGADMRFADKMAGGKTGVIGILDCGEGPTVALRYDIDALPVTEDNTHEHRPVREGYRSQTKGLMHACGHDGHITVGLGTAKALAKYKDTLHGKVKIIFQPGEEGLYGAKTIVHKGHLDDVDYALASHMGGDPDTKPGVMLLGSGATLATYKFDADFHGSPSHAGFAPQEGQNAILAAAAAITNLHAIPRHGEGDTRINVGKIYGGSARNIIAPFAHIEGEVRGTTQQAVDYMEQYVKRIIAAAAEMHDCTVEITAVGSAGVNENSTDLTALVLDICRKNGIDAIDAGLQKARASEDFAHMAKSVQEHGGKSCYFNILSKCSGNPHQSVFDFDEGALTEGVKTYTFTVMELLK